MPATGLLLRDREVLERLLTSVSAGHLCAICEKPVVLGLFHWLGQDGNPQRVRDRIVQFADWRHVDGTPGHRPAGAGDHGTISGKAA